MAKISKGWAFVGVGSQAAAGNDQDIQFNNNGNLSASHDLRTNGTGSLSASAGITGSAFKTDGMVSASTFHGDGRHILNITAAATQVADGPQYSVQFRFDTPIGGEISGSNKFMYDQSQTLLRLTGSFSSVGDISASAGLTGSAFKTDGPISGGALSASAGLDLGAGHRVYIGGSTILTSVGLGPTIVGSSLTSVGTLSSLAVGAVTSTGVVSSSAGITGSSFLTDGAISGSIIYGDGSQLGGISAGGPASLASGSARLSFATGTGILTLSGSITASNGITGSAFKTDGPISGGALSASAGLDLGAGHRVYIGGSTILTSVGLGPTIVGSSLTSVGTLVGLTSSSPIVANGGVKATELSSSGRAYLGGAGSVSIGGTSVLTKNTLGSSVVGSSLTSVGTLSSLAVGAVTSTGVITSSVGITGSAFKTDGVLSAGAINLSPTTGSKAGPSSYLVLDTNNKVVLTAGAAAGAAGAGGIFTTPNGSTAYTTSSVQIGGSGTPSHALEVIGLVSASAGLKIRGDAQFTSTLSVTGTVRGMSHVSASGDLISARNITGSGDLRLDYGGEGASAIYIANARVLTSADIGTSVLASSLTSVGTLVGVTSSSPVVANGGVKATTVSASTSVLGANVTPYLTQQILDPQTNYALFTITNSNTTTYRVVWDTGDTSCTDPVVAFAAPPSGKVMVDLNHYIDDTSTSGDGPAIYACLSTSTAASIDNDDGTIVTGVERRIWYPDEADDVMINYSFLVESLTPGNSYTWYLFLRRYNDGDLNRVICGKNYPLFQMSVRAILETADIYNA